MEDQRLQLVLALAFLVVFAAGLADLVLDRPTTLLSLHVLVEAVIVLGSLGLAVILWRRWRLAARSLDQARRSLDERRAERDAWRENARRALEGLSLALQEQFGAWGLTPTEAEVALHLLKGHSHKHTAKATDRSERTVRQHAVSVYRKAGVAGRAELAAFFLEDLMLPPAGRSGRQPGGPPAADADRPLTADR